MAETNAPDAAAAGADSLLAWASAAARRDVHSLPPRVITKALTVICDDIAAMVAASAEPEIQKVNALAVAEAPNGGAHGLGAGSRGEVSLPVRCGVRAFRPRGLPGFNSLRGAYGGATCAHTPRVCGGLCP